MQDVKTCSWCSANLLSATWSLRRWERDRCGPCRGWWLNSRAGFAVSDCCCCSFPRHTRTKTRPLCGYLYPAWCLLSHSIWGKGICGVILGPSYLTGRVFQLDLHFLRCPCSPALPDLQVPTLPPWARLLNQCKLERSCSSPRLSQSVPQPASQPHA